MKTSIVIIVIFVLMVVWMYNRLVTSKNLVQEAWSGVEVLLKMRHDLVPNLVNIVKAYATHEQSTLEETMRARDGTLDKHTPRASGEAESKLNSKLVHVLAVAEDYPELKADSMFKKLMNDLVRVEDDLQLARRYFNGTVRNQNNLIEHFPSNLVAKTFRFSIEDFFELERLQERQSPNVDLNS